MKITLKTFLLTAFTLFLFNSFSYAQTKAERIEELVNKYGERSKFNGSYLVAQDGKVLAKGGVGAANIGNK